MKKVRSENNRFLGGGYTQEKKIHQCVTNEVPQYGMKYVCVSMFPALISLWFSGVNRVQRPNPPPILPY